MFLILIIYDNTSCHVIKCLYNLGEMPTYVICYFTKTFPYDDFSEVLSFS